MGMEDKTILGNILEDNDDQAVFEHPQEETVDKLKTDTAEASECTTIE